MEQREHGEGYQREQRGPRNPSTMTVLVTVQVTVFVAVLIAVAAPVRGERPWWSETADVSGYSGDDEHDCGQGQWKSHDRPDVGGEGAVEDDTSHRGSESGEDGRGNHAAEVGPAVDRLAGGRGRTGGRW